MIHHRDGELQWYQFALLAAQPFVTHGVFGRAGGVSRAPYASLNAGPTTPDDAEARAENYRRIRATLPHRPLLVGSAPQQATAVYEVTAEDVAAHAAAESSFVILPGARDAFITRERGVGVFWAVADCCVILLADPVHGAIGLAHAGWRGTAGAILRNTVGAMHERYGTEPSDLVVGIAPTIGPCCYEVDEPVRRAFADDPLAERTGRFSTVTTQGQDGSTRESLRLDLAASNHAQLLALGVPEGQIDVSEYCPGMRTDLFFSHRMEGGSTGRFAVVLGLV